MKQNYHDLLPVQPIRFPDGFTLSDEQEEAIKEALKDKRVLQAKNYREQCFILCTILHDTNSIDKTIVTYDVIGAMFNPVRNHGSIIKEAKKYEAEVNVSHRPYILFDFEVEVIKEELEKCGKDYPSIEDLSFFIANRFKKFPSITTIKRTIKERLKGYKITKVKPIDDDRYDVSLEDIQQFYTDLTEELENVPVGFCFNLDESGENLYQDAHNLYLVVPEDDNIETYPNNRAIKRITLLHCISTDGTSCDPMIVVPRLTIDDEIFDEIPSQTVLFRTQEKGYCTHILFTDWFMEKFIPYLASQQEKYNYYEKSVLIMDGFKGHEKSLETLNEILDKFKIKIMFIPPHSSDQVQPLDLFGFNIQKNRSQKFRFNPYYSLQTNQILAILDGLSVIKSPHAITTAWRMMGVYRKRIDRRFSPDDALIQYHTIDIRLNKKIRGLHYEEERLHGSNYTRKAQKVLEPNDIYIKRKELHIKTQEEVSRPVITHEEAFNLRRKYRLKDNGSIKPTDELRAKLITDYFKPIEKATFIQETPKKKTRGRPRKIAVLRIPPDA